MENYANFAGAKPSPEEKREIRKHYFRTAWIIIVLVLIFGPLDTLAVRISAGIMSGGFTGEKIKEGKKLIKAVPVMAATYQYAFPIIADICALMAGIVITKADLGKKLKRVNMTGREFWCSTAVTFTVATIASMINWLLILILLALSGKLTDMNVSDAAEAVSVVSAKNPLWLDILIYLYVCLVGPILEELVFRGVLLEGLRKYGNRFGIIMSAVMFGLMHQNIVQCIPAIAIGIVWAYADIKSGSLLPSIFLHILNNTMSAIVMVMMESIDISKIMSDPYSIIKSSWGFFTASGVMLLFRAVCMIAFIVIAVRYYSKRRGSLAGTNAYTKERTWKYFFTSLPWLIVTVYLVVTTVTSVSRIA